MAKVGGPLEATAGDTAVRPVGADVEPLVPVHFCPGSGSLPPERARGPAWPDYAPASC